MGAHIDKGEELKARKLYRKLFHRELASRWTFYWGHLGSTDDFHAEVQLHQQDCVSDIPTLVHELVHVRHPKWKHGKKFSKEVRRLSRKALNHVELRGL